MQNDKLEQYVKQIQEYRHTLKKKFRLKEKINIMQKCYDYLKIIAPNFYDFPNINKEYYPLLKELYACEDALPFRYIIDITPNNYYFDKYWFKSSDKILDFIVNEARKNILGLSKNDKFLYPHRDLTNNCLNTALFIKNLCEQFNIDCQIIKLVPGYTESFEITNGTNYHYLDIITYQGQKYLVDCTYSQFFLLNRCLIQKTGVMLNCGASAGTFMLKNENRLKVAQKILKNGWIPLKKGVLKNYLDGFTLSYRNGLYYELTNDFSYEVIYTEEDYLRFLNNEDNQINHESEVVLGYQKQPLKNPYLNF